MQLQRQHAIAEGGDVGGDTREHVRNLAGSLGGADEENVAMGGNLAYGLPNLFRQDERGETRDDRDRFLNEGFVWHGICVLGPYYGSCRHESDFRKGAAGRLGAKGSAPDHDLTRSRRRLLLRGGARLTLRDSDLSGPRQSDAG